MEEETWPATSYLPQLPFCWWAKSFFSLAPSIRTYPRFRGQALHHVPGDPESGGRSGNVAKAVAKALFGKEQVRLDQCSRWPEKRNCGQECLSRVHADPRHCLVWSMVGEWYKGKSCAYCQKPFL
jgi:hypothetical protein